MNNKKPLTRFLLVIILIIIIGGFAYIWDHSIFGADIDRSLISATSTIPKISRSSSNLSEAKNLLVTPPTENSTARSKCGNSESMSIFVLGIDRHEQTDVIRLVNIDFTIPKVSVLSVPRDLWVLIPNLEANRIMEGRINSAYGYGEYFTGKGEGPKEFASTLSTNFGVTFEHYLTLHDSAFVTLVDDIGGIDITLKEPVDGTNQPFDGTTEYLPYFDAGIHHMDGITALKFTKIRYQDSDKIRVDRQSQVIMEIFKKVTQPANRILIPKIAYHLLTENFVSTDLTLSEISDLICLAQSMNTKDLSFHSLPTEYYSNSISSEGGSILLPSPQLSGYIQDYFSGKY